MKSRIINWDSAAIKQFNKAIQYIAEDSLQNAQKVKKGISEKIEKIITHPEIYSPDKFKQNNDGNFRAFELYHYRITNYVSETEIRILRVRHTKQEPKAY